MNLKSKIVHATSYSIDFILRNIGRNFKAEVLNNLSFCAKDNLYDIELDCPAMILPDPNDIKLIKRIMKSYDLAKKAQKDASSVFLPSSLWQNQLDIAYESLYGGDLEKTSFFLTNFGAWPEYTGIENTKLILDMSKTTFQKRQMKRIFGKLVNFWLQHEAVGKSIEDLTYPRFGNQYGAVLKGKFIGLGSVFNDIHSNVLANLVKRNEPIIGEIGGGYGKLFYFISRKISNFKYLNFDLPETLCCAAYYLIKTFPNSKFLLFGEDSLCAKSISEHDFILMPSFSIEDLPSNSIDLFINKNSLGEMRSNTTLKFINEIERTTNYFWHLNHEFVRNNFEDGTSSLLNNEYELSENKFLRLSRYLDLGHAIYQGNFNVDSDCYCYLYKRR